ncbi:hypothetical protein [Paraglaciecola arctica]|uniref:hypothetical protein n=1 Tax=Paraglaciecola arctica TaxID=1128911 RepID=UPI001C066D2F|nr:hypothetical protein [Paraglaciecola arctica]MBU3003642.1 hypothetical protein [Paraglaciecola arctica]
MKYIHALFLIVALSVNAYAGSDLCSMEHEVISEAPHAMPCHEIDPHQENKQEPEQQQKQQVKSHLCDCDMCVQLISSTNIIKSNALFNETPRFIDISYQSLASSPKYRPPIYFLS